MINGNFFHDFVLDSINSVLNLEVIHSDNSRYLPLSPFVDEEYDGSDFINGNYRFDMVADLDDMMTL